MTATRLKEGGIIDRTKPLSFTWDGQRMSGFKGDTLASALLSCNEKVLARSFKYHRPRGVMSAGVEESGALVTIGNDAYTTPNVRATTQEIYQGLVAKGQNAIPNVRYDINEINSLFSRFLSAGFYYKTFMGLPPFEHGKGTKIWMWYEQIIRRAAGMGKASREPDPASYEHCNAFCDVLVVGSGIAGLSAAIAAARSGVDVVLVEQDFEFGGNSLSDSKLTSLRNNLLKEVSTLNISMMKRTTAFGLYDHACVGLLEKLTDHLADPAVSQPRERFWIMRAKQIIIATGAIERNLVFTNNDKPGVMTVNAAGHYLNRHGLLTGNKIIITTNNDSVYQTAVDLQVAGAEVTIFDIRPSISQDLAATTKNAGVHFQGNTSISSTSGFRMVKSIGVIGRHSSHENWYSYGETAECDLLLVSGGWSPVVNLVSHLGIKPVWNNENQCFIAPSSLPNHVHIAGSACGLWQSKDCITSGKQVAKAAVLNINKQANVAPTITTDDSVPDNIPTIGGWVTPIEPLFEIDSSKKNAFVDFQHDVTASDIRLAKQEGFVSVEHLKRYTTLGMANDQGKMGNVTGLSILANELGKTIGQVGTTTFRPPYTSVSIGALAGRNTGSHFRTLRRTAFHEWNLKQGAVMTMAGLWQRPWYYPKDGEDFATAYCREAETVRKTVGICDVTSLGKIAIQGVDATTLINRIYSNNFAKLPVGKLRYGVMLRDDGMVMDDGTTWRLAENDYFMTTTTANAAKIMAFLEECVQIRWPDLKVHLSTVSDQWAAAAIAGPLSRQVLASCLENPDVISDENLPFMGHIDTPLKNGVIGRIGRVSFSGERAFEIYVPSTHAEEVIDTLWQKAKELDGCLYGLEALGTLRIEKGHVTGAELDGRVTIDDAGFGKMASTTKSYVGSVLANREQLKQADRPQVVGIFPKDKSKKFNAGAILCEQGNVKGLGVGYITSVTHSPALGHWIGIGFINGGYNAWNDKPLVAADPVRSKGQSPEAIEVVSPHMYDPSGGKMRG